MAIAIFLHAYQFTSVVSRISDLNGVFFFLLESCEIKCAFNLNEIGALFFPSFIFSSFFNQKVKTSSKDLNSDL